MTTLERGDSAIAYLKELPVDVLKIDRSYISGLTDNRKDAAIVAAMIALGHSLDLKIVAEGVETRDQHETLRKMACDELQGLLYVGAGYGPRICDPGQEISLDSVCPVEFNGHVMRTASQIWPDSGRTVSSLADAPSFLMAPYTKREFLGPCKSRIKRVHYEHSIQNFKYLHAVVCNADPGGLRYCSNDMRHRFPGRGGQ